MKNKEGFYSKDDIGILGSYSSFLALLLVATILSFRHIIDYAYELISKGASGSAVDTIFIILIILDGLIFIVVPSIPVISSIKSSFREKRLWLSWTLVFISAVYVFAVISQFLYALLDKVIK